MSFERRLNFPRTAQWHALLRCLSQSSSVVSARADLSTNAGLLVAVMVFVVAYVADGANRNAGIDGARLNGSAVTVARVNAPDDGFIVIHSGGAERNSIDPKGLAYVPVRAGLSTDLTLELHRSVSPEAKLFVVLHSDTGQKGVFEYGASKLDVDGPRAAGGELVWASVSTR